MYRSLKKDLIDRFGEPVLKIPLNAGFTCPNLDGSKGRGGCIYCDNAAFSPVALNREGILQQMRAGIHRAGDRYRLFIAYFQPYSNTYASVDYLRQCYEPVLQLPGVVGISIGTRPDCFSGEIYDYLQELAERTWLSVEIGVQTVHEATLKKINRKHTFAESAAAFRELAARNIETVAHVMFGLPGESPEQMLETVSTLAALPVRGLKFHQLMVIRGTALEKMYRRGSYRPLNADEYIGLVAEALRRMRPDQVVHRLMADCRPEDGLLAPMWSMQKKRVLNAMQVYFQKNHIQQGESFAVLP